MDEEHLFAEQNNLSFRVEALKEVPAYQITHRNIFALSEALVKWCMLVTSSTDRSAYDAAFKARQVLNRRIVKQTINAKNQKYADYVLKGGENDSEHG